MLHSYSIVLQKRHGKLSRTKVGHHTSFYGIDIFHCTVELKNEQWKCGMCSEIKYTDMIMCDDCTTWFHW